METQSNEQLHIFFLPFMAKGHSIPLVDIAKLIASRGVKSTLIATSVHAPSFSKAIQTTKDMGFDIDILVIKFPYAEVGLPEGCESAGPLTDEMTQKFFMATFLLPPQIEQLLDQHRPHCLVADSIFHWTTDLAAKFGIPRIIFEVCGFFPLIAAKSVILNQPHKKVSSDTELFSIPDLPVEIKMTRTQIPAYFDQDAGSEVNNLFKISIDCEQRSYGVIINSFYELEPVFADHYRKVLGRKAWHVGPISLRNKAAKVKAEVREMETSFDEDDECLNWLNSKKPNSVIYVCFGTLVYFSDSQLSEIALGLEASGQDFIWVVRKEKEDKEEWLPEGYEKRIEGRGLIIRGWAPQVLILEHQATGAFVTHCGWNSFLEGLSAGVPMITWPVSAEQFYNEKFITQIVRSGLAVGAHHSNAFSDVKKEFIVKSETLVKAVKGVIVGDQAEEMRGRAKELAEMAKKAVEEGGSSFSDLTALIEELRSFRA